MWSKPVYTNRKSASAERCLRALGVTPAMGIPVMIRSKHSRQGVFSHQGLRKASAADPVNTGLAGSAGIAGIDHRQENHSVCDQLLKASGILNRFAIPFFHPPYAY